MRLQIIEKPGFNLSCVKKALSRHKIKTVKKGGDLILSIGGDGMVIKAMKKGLPVLAINAGALGFLTQGSIKELDSKLRQLKANKFHIVDKNMLECSVGKKKFLAVNDLYFCSRPGRALWFKFYINNTAFPRVIGDGLLMSTPTGSTAYCSSAGGPIVRPGLECMVLTPVNPHISKSAPIVLAGSDTVKIEFDACNTDIFLSCDGTKPIRTTTKQKPVVEISKKKARLVEFKDDYFKRLSKLFS